MKRIFTLIILAALTVILYMLWPLLTRDPEVLAVGLSLGVVLGALAGVPVGLLVLAAQRRSENREWKREQAAPRQPQPAMAYPMAMHPNFVMPHGMQDVNMGSWHSNGQYDMTLGPPPVRD